MPKKLLVILCCLLVSIATYAQEVAVFPQLGHTGRVWSVAFSPDGKQILSGSWDGTIKLWDIASGREHSKILHELLS